MPTAKRIFPCPIRPAEREHEVLAAGLARRAPRHPPGRPFGEHSPRHHLDGGACRGGPRPETFQGGLCRRALPRKTGSWRLLLHWSLISCWPTRADFHCPISPCWLNIAACPLEDTRGRGARCQLPCVVIEHLAASTIASSSSTTGVEASGLAMTPPRPRQGGSRWAPRRPTNAAGGPPRGACRSMF